MFAISTRNKLMNHSHNEDIRKEKKRKRSIICPSIHTYDETAMSNIN